MPGPVESGRTLSLCLFAAGLLLLSGCGMGKLTTLSSSRPLPDVDFLTPLQHDSVMAAREWPYVLDVASNNAALLYYGSWHTRDPDDAQIDDMVTRWQEFGPTVAVTENRGGLHLGGLRGAVKSLGEFGVAVHMADEAGIPVWSLEPTWEDEIAFVTEVYTPAEATIFYTLRVFLSERGSDRSASSTDKLAKHLLGKRGSRPGLDGSLTSLEEMDALWASNFGDSQDWRSLPPEAVWPHSEGTHLQQLSFRVNAVRNHHSARVILDLLSEGNRVFAIAGGSHVVMQEPVLRAGFPD